MKTKLFATVLLMHVTYSICQAVPNLPVDVGQAVTLIEGTISIKDPPVRDFSKFRDALKRLPEGMQHMVTTNQIVYNTKWPFKIQINKDKYEIITIMPETQSVQSEITYYDGINQIHYRHFRNPPPNSKSSAVGHIDDTPVPRFTTSKHGVIWMALASSCFFQSVTNNVTVSSLGYPQKFKFLRYQPGSWILSKTAPYLPERVSIMFAPPKYFNNEVVRVGLPEVYKNGYERELYEVESFTNFLGKVYPSKFRYQTFAPKEAGTSANDLTNTITVMGWVDKISEINTWIHFEPQPISYVEDFRGTNLNLQYKMTNYIVSNEQDEFYAKQRARANKVADIKTTQTSEYGKKRKSLVSFGVLTFFAFPTILYIVYRRMGAKGK